MKKMDVRAIVAVGSVFLSCVAGAASTCTWSGAAGDGKWSTPENWTGGVAPVDGDSVTIPAGTTGTMDAGDAVRTLGGFTVKNPVGSFTLTGAGLNINNNVTLPNYGNQTVVYDCPISLVGGSRTLTIGASTNSVMKFMKPVSAATIAATSFTGSTQDKGSTPRTYFYAPMSYTTLNLRYNYIYCQAANVLSPTGTVYFSGTGWGNIFHGSVLDLYGYDQTVGGLKSDLTDQWTYYTASDGWKNRARNIRSTASGKKATLTICGGASVTSDARFYSNMNVVFAPTSSDVTYTFHKRWHTMNGALVISNGTFVIDWGATFSNVTQVAVLAGATLKLTDQVFNAGTNALAGLTQMYVDPKATLDLPTGTGGVLPVTTTDNIHYYRAATTGTTKWRVSTGDWGTAANWTEGAPAATVPAEIAPLAGTMKVTLTADAPVATNLTMGSPVLPATVAASELTVSAKLPLDNAHLDFGLGSKVTVKSGGLIEDIGQMYQYTKNNANNVHRFDLHDGAEMTVENGGSVILSNTCGQVTVGTDTTAGKLTVAAGGNFEFRSGQTSTVFRVCDCGEVNVAGRLAIYRRFKNSRAAIFNAGGGVINVTGDGILEFPNETGPLYKGNGGQSWFYFDSITLKDNACMAMGTSSTWDTDTWFQPYAAGRTAIMRIQDNACLSNRWGHLYFRSCAGSRAHYQLDASTQGVKDFDTMRFTIGGNKGDTQFDYAGNTISAGTFGLNVGHWTGSGYVSETNTVNLGSAEFYVSASTSIDKGQGGIGFPFDQHYGSIIGVHIRNSSELTAAQRCPVSTFNLLNDKSVYTQENGHFILGAGRAEGRFIQHAGKSTVATTTVKGTEDTNTNQVTVVGAWGGLGELIVSNGTCKIGQRIFVGGVATNDYVSGYYINNCGRHLNYHDAEGLVRVAGGAFTFTKEMTLGKDGSGTLEIGPRCAVTGAVVKLLGPTAALKFTLDAANGYKSGLTKVNKLAVSSGAKVQVDLGDYHGKSKTLLVFGAKEGDFAAGDISVTGANANDYAVDVRTDRIILKANIGAVILLR